MGLFGVGSGSIAGSNGSLLFLLGLGSKLGVLNLGPVLSNLEANDTQKGEHNEHLRCSNNVNAGMLINLTPVVGHGRSTTTAQVGQVNDNSDHVEEKTATVKELVGFTGLVQLEEEANHTQHGAEMVDMMKEHGHVVPVLVMGKTALERSINGLLPERIVVIGPVGVAHTK